jgi:Flp pilus assembly protein TadG
MEAMLMNRSFRKQILFGYQGQAIVEFAIALPILLALLVGILEVGRMVFIYSAVTNASREAVRYASAVGLDESGNAKYQYCDGIRKMARRSAYFLNLADSDIAITYDHGPGTGSFDTCSGSADTGVVVNSGSTPDRVLVEVTANYSPMVRLIPLGSRPIISKSARTILGILNMTTGQSSVPGGGGPGPSSTATPTTAPSQTPTATVQPSNTPHPSHTPKGSFSTLTPIPSSTPTVMSTVGPSQTPTATVQPSATPTITQTFTPSATPTMTQTFTPTATPTAVTGCGNITTGSIITANNSTTMSMTITNPNVYAVTVQNVQVKWNSATGASGNKTLTLQMASLGAVFWTGSDTTGDLTITPSTTVTIPASTTSTIIFTFDKNYQNPSGNSIIINLSTPGCASSPIHRP